ncbi:MAG TPA: hypothetical protein VK016_03095 [Arenimonas sp.]|jgi:hypothetical protein|nr:hypothetical protein [Arenimonas sp.]
MNIRLAFLLTLCMLLLAPPAQAQAVRLDDSRTQVLGSALRLEWVDSVPRPGTAQLMSGSITVHVRLDVRAWKGRNVRIYKMLEPTAGARMLVRWTGQGRLADGQLQEGQRSLVYAGPITTDELQDVLQVTVLADGNRYNGRESLRFHFELEEGAL